MLSHIGECLSNVLLNRPTGHTAAELAVRLAEATPAFHEASVIACWVTELAAGGYWSKTIVVRLSPEAESRLTSTTPEMSLLREAVRRIAGLPLPLAAWFDDEPPEDSVEIQLERVGVAA